MWWWGRTAASLHVGACAGAWWCLTWCLWCLTRGGTGLTLTTSTLGAGATTVRWYTGRTSLLLSTTAVLLLLLTKVKLSAFAEIVITVISASVKIFFIFVPPISWELNSELCSPEHLRSARIDIFCSFVWCKVQHFFHPTKGKHPKQGG